MSLLGLRAAAMLHYVTDLALLLRSKSGGRSLREEPALPRLLESRVVIGRERGGGRGLGGRAVVDWGVWGWGLISILPLVSMGVNGGRGLITIYELVRMGVNAGGVALLAYPYCWPWD